MNFNYYNESSRSDDLLDVDLGDVLRVMEDADSWYDLDSEMAVDDFPISALTPQQEPFNTLGNFYHV